MGKGDKKTRRGKISMGTYGVSRPKKADKQGPADSASESASSKKEEKK